MGAQTEWDADPAKLKQNQMEERGVPEPQAAPTPLPAEQAQEPINRGPAATEIKDFQDKYKAAFDKAMDITPEDRKEIDTYNRVRKTRRLLEWAFPDYDKWQAAFDSGSLGFKLDIAKQLEEEYGKPLDAIVPSTPQKKEMEKSSEQKGRDMLLKVKKQREV